MLIRNQKYANFIVLLLLLETRRAGRQESWQINAVLLANTIMTAREWFFRSTLLSKAYVDGIVSHFISRSNSAML